MKVIWNEKFEWRIMIFRFWACSWIVNITLITVYRVIGSLFNWTNLIQVGFETLIIWLCWQFRSRIRSIPFSFLIVPLFSKAVWNRVIGFMSKLSVFLKLTFTFVIRISYLCNFRFKIWIIKFAGYISRLQFRCYTINFQWHIRSTIVFSFVICPKSTSLTSVWTGLKGSIAVEVCLDCCFWAKLFSFLGNPGLKVSIHLSLIVAAKSLHQPFSNIFELFRA